MKSKQIYDDLGRPLRLEHSRLIEDHRPEWVENWMASFANIRKAYKANTGTILIEETTNTGKRPNTKTGHAVLTCFYRPGVPVRDVFTSPVGVIGCRNFTTRTFNIIMKAAGVKLTTKKKALAAKAGR